MKLTLSLLALAGKVAADFCFFPAYTDADGAFAYDTEVCVSDSGAITANVTGDVGGADLAAVEGIYTDLDATWIMIAGILVFFMQAGFAMLEAGCVSAKNVQNILYKNLMDACVGALGFWVAGYAIAYGTAEDGGLIGTGNFLLMEEDNTTHTYHNFFFQWAFAATAATIVSGSVAERCKLSAYFVYSLWLTIFVYPVVVHWVWDTEGWLCAWSGNQPFGSNGLVDFAGSGVVHMVGGFSGLMGAIAVGPRLGRFEEKKGVDGKVIKHEEHNKLLASLGVCILWFGWYGFNCGSTLMISQGMSNLAAKVAVTTTLAAASAAVTCTVYSIIVLKRFDLMLSLNGVLAGLVSITANCAVVEPWAAVVIGLIGAFVYIGSSALLVKLKIDDPLDACPIHGFCGFWAVLAAGIFGTAENIMFAYGNENTNQFLVQLLSALIILAWTIVTSGICFFGMKYTMGMRVEESVELDGLDTSEHGGAVYSSELADVKA